MSSKNKKNSEHESTQDTQNKQPNQGVRKEPLNVPDTTPRRDESPTRGRNNSFKQR